mmetsp:Transcript_18404/g.56477  ORF Transcript_18404/g.56477 Transcript_18404/m.56477 type:complete len:494 (-) Transcript_18404:68-1549(-)
MRAARRVGTRGTWNATPARSMSSQPLLRVNPSVDPDVDELRAKQATNLWHPMTQQRQWALAEKKPPVPVVSSAGCTLTRADGSEVIDAIAGLWCVNVGYGREELAAVAYETMRELPYHAPTLASPPQIQLASKIGELLDLEGGTHAYFTASGSEANEAAFKMARQYHAANGNALKYKIVSRYRAYHGNTAGAMAATGQAERKIGFGPEPPGFVKVPAPYPYRGRDDMHVDDVLRALDETISFEGAETVAAFVLEPYVSGGGVLIPPDSYLQRVREICDKHDVLLILDEVVSGFGRTGKMFGHQHSHGVKPDLLTMAKGLSSGYVPLGAVAANEKVFSKFFDTESAMAPRLANFRQINTYGGHPVACAVALRNVEIIEREHLVDRAARLGAYFHDRLDATLGSHPLVGEVRGKGLLLGVELVQDKLSKKPLHDEALASILPFCNDHGVIVGRNGTTIPGLNNVLILAPPFVITEAECDAIASTLRAALDDVLSF